MKSGQIEVEKASLTSPLIALGEDVAGVDVGELSVNATADRTELRRSARRSELPDVTGASVQILFAKRTLSLMQGSAKIGNSDLHDIGRESI